MLLLGVAAAALAADYATKEIALASFAPGESMQIVGDLLKFTLVFNTGAAFSMGQGVPWLFFFIAVGVVVYILFMARKLGSLPWTFALGLILGGALGNLADRAFRPPEPALHGAVVDWIQVPNFPVFNIADSCIVVGGAFAVLLAFRGFNIDGTREPAAPSKDTKDTKDTGGDPGAEDGRPNENAAPEPGGAAPATPETREPGTGRTDNPLPGGDSTTRAPGDAADRGNRSGTRPEDDGQRT